MRTLDFALPGSIERRTGGTIYDRRIVEGLRARGWSVTVHELAGRFPLCDDAALAAADAVLAAAARPLVIDGLALPAFRLAERDPAAGDGVIALIHHPLAEEAGLAPAVAAALRQGERADLARVGGVIVTSGFTAGVLSRDFGVPPARLAVVHPGVDPNPPGARRATLDDRPVRLVSVASIVPRKGHRALLEALQPLSDLSWDLICIGPADRDPALSESLLEYINNNALVTKVHFSGEVDDAAVRGGLAAADLFVHAAEYEGYGMALAEALKSGVPIVAVGGGAVPEVVPAGAGILCPPGDVAALTAALRRMIVDPAHRRRLADGAAAAGAALPAWATAAGRFAAAVGHLVP